VIRTAGTAIPVTILVATLAVAAILFGPRPPAATVPNDVPISASVSPLATPATFKPVPRTTPARPSAKAIYKGHTLDEIVADPSLLAGVLSEADYIRPIHGEAVPRLRDTGSDTVCPNHVECP